MSEVWSPSKAKIILLVFAYASTGLGIGFLVLASKFSNLSLLFGTVCLAMMCFCGVIGACQEYVRIDRRLTAAKNAVCEGKTETC
jgi:hypothetical protein